MIYMNKHHYYYFSFTSQIKEKYNLYSKSEISVSVGNNIPIGSVWLWAFVFLKVIKDFC